MIFFSRKPKVSAFPPGWPSPYHNKCTQRDCQYPNNPQTVKGVYQCRGVPGGFFCEGSYKISSSRAQETERYLKEVAIARRAVEEEQRKRTVSQMKRPESNARYRERELPDSGTMSAGARLGYGRAPGTVQLPRSHRVSDAKRPQVAHSRRPSYAVPRPTSSQIETEFVTDQIMMHLYPERQIQPRWI